MSTQYSLFLVLRVTERRKTKESTGTVQGSGGCRVEESVPARPRRIYRCRYNVLMGKSATALHRYPLGSVIFRIESNREEEEKKLRGGLVLKAHRLLHHSTLGLRVITKKQKEEEKEY